EPATAGDGQRGGAELGDPGLHRLGRAVADRDEEDDRGHPDEHAQDGQRGAELVRGHAPDGGPDGLEDVHPNAPSRWVRTLSSTIPPSTNRISRRACSATSGSWVMRTI